MPSTYLCVGGPHAGSYLTEEEAGPDYYRFSSASGEHYPLVIVNRKRTGAKFRTLPKSGWVKRHCKTPVTPYVPKSLLVYFEVPETIVITVD